MRLRNWVFTSFIICLVCLTGCGRQSTPPPVVSTNAVPTPTTSINATSTVQVVQDAPQIQTLVIWLPETLSGGDDETVIALLEDQILEFEETQGNVNVELRRKRSQDLGGIVPTIRTGSAVAPGALPDLTLLSREDLLNMAQNDLIQPLEGLISSSIISSMNDPALQLGFYENQLYGLTYLLDMLLLTYNPQVDAPAEWTFDEILRNRLSFAFPVGNVSGVNRVFLLQYLSAGGEMPMSANDALNEDALLSTLQFYERAVDLNLIDRRAVSYTAFNDYIPRLLEGSLDAGVVNISTFNRLRNDDYQPNAAPIPMMDDVPLTFLSGWMWVLVSNDANQQMLAAEFINWMMDVDRQGEYAQTVGLIASQAQARRLYPREGLENTLIDTLLLNPVIIPQEGTNTATMRAMQTALVAVLNSELSAEEATREVMEQLSG